MRVPSSDFNFSFSPGPSPERIFTPSPSQSSSLFGSRSDASTPSSVPSGSSSPASNFHSQAPPGGIFGEPFPSSTRTFTSAHSPSSNIFRSSPNVRTSASVSATSPPPGFSENTTRQDASGSIFDGPHTTGGRIFASSPSQSSSLFGSRANARSSSTVPESSPSFGPSANSGQNPVTGTFGRPQTSGTKISSPSPHPNSVFLGTRPDVRLHTTAPNRVRSSIPASSDNTSQTESGSIFGGSSSSGTVLFTPPVAPSCSIFGSSFTAQTSSHSPEQHSQAASSSIFSTPQASGTRYYTPPPLLSGSPNVGTSTTVPARTDTPGSSQTASGSIFDGPTSTETSFFTPQPSRSPDVKMSYLARTESSSPGPSHHDYQTQRTSLFNGPPSSGKTTLSSGLFTGVGLSESSIASRSPNPRLSVLPSRNMPRYAPALPFHTAIHTEPSNSRLLDGGLGAETGSVNGHSTSQATDQARNTDSSIISPVDEDVQSSNTIEDDPFSPDPIDDQNFQMNFTAVQVQIQELSRVISECPLSQDPESRLHEIHLNAKELSEYKDQETRIVGFIGETGAGKCLIIE
ncbi:unnamed protein product [Penicillium pancosmium]